MLFRSHIVNTADTASFFRDTALLHQLGINPPAVIRLREALNEHGFHLSDQLLEMEELAAAVAQAVKHHE